MPFMVAAAMCKKLQQKSQTLNFLNFSDFFAVADGALLSSPVLSCPLLSSPLLSFCFILRFAQTLVLDSLRLCFWIRSGCILGFAQTLISDSLRLYAWIRSGCIRGFAQTLILDSLRCMFQFAQAFILDSLRPCPPAPPAPSHTRN